jgi:ankyrin repeat protein
MWATSAGKMEAVKALIESRAEVNARVHYSGNTPLIEALHKKYLDLANYLIEQGADVNLKTQAGWSPIKMAVFMGYGETLRSLLQAGANVNERDNQGKTPLMWASIKGHSDIARMLIQAGADVYASDNFGFTAWVLAKDGKQIGILQVLRDAGVKDYKNLMIVRGSNGKATRSRGFSWGMGGGFVSSVR